MAKEALLLTSELETLIRAASRSGEALMRHFERRTELEVRLKGPADFVSNADLESEKTLADILLGAHPHRGFVAEEGAARQGTEPARYIVDPLDGTTNFVHGVPHFCVSLALEREGRMVAGVVHDPAKDEMFVAERGAGAWLGRPRAAPGAWTPLRVSADADFTLALIATGIPHASARQRHARYLPMLARAMHEAAGIRRLGAAALDLAYVASGRFGSYFEMGLKPWDLAAGALLVEEAGGRVTDLGGGGDYLSSGEIVATNGPLHSPTLALLAASPPR